ncbi:uncharacterized protein LOC131026362 [Salvia miltiorrhiza]|uniref:uncharacterized protein LOC131026362 n=1 Tax=Salvia miltiorrhiza TaxID=226208 RepID=UPI0025AC5C5A|nr:uncharacterized protein LOC131026362 [Salvia miltiorrhiza]
MGLYINPETGRSVLNPGMSTSLVINEGRSMEPEPNTRFAIPNESELRKGKRKQTQTVADPSKLRKVASKSFKAPRGNKEEVVLRRFPRGKNIASTVDSTTTS